MLKPKLYLVMATLGILVILAGGCAQPAPVPSPVPAPAPAPAPIPAPTPPPVGTGTVEVYVTDAPPRDEVKSILVTASQIEIHKAAAEQEREQEQSSSDNQTQEQEQEQQQTQEGQGRWITLDISEQAATFDLLQIRGIEEFFATGQVDTGKYTQIRLKIEKVEVALGDKAPQEATVPSKELKLVRPFDVVAGENTVIVLDFDADRMVNVTGAGKIMVKPVVKLMVRQEKPKGQPDGEKPEKPTKEQALVEVDCDDFMANNNISQEVQVNVGDSFQVSLCSNPTTGFQWSESAQISDQSVVEQTGHEFVPPQAESGQPPAPGTSGKEIWTFQALETGTTTISMEYSRPWEGGEKGEWTFTLNVTVE